VLLSTLVAERQEGKGIASTRLLEDGFFATTNQLSGCQETT
jgi:hypothetical protein